MMTLIEIAKKNNASLYAEQAKWVPSWRELRDYFAPSRGMFPGDRPNDGRMIDHKKILNGKPMQAAASLAAGLTANMTSPSHPWFDLSLLNKELLNFPNVKLWISAIKDNLYSIFKKANTYSVLNWLYLEFAVIGTGAVMVLEDPENVIKYRTFTVGEFAFGVDANGKPNRFTRNFKMTVKQMIDEFGRENVSQTVRNLYDNYNYDASIDVCFLICDNEKRIPEIKNNRNMPFLSLYWETAENGGKFLSISGFEEFPVLIPRWEIKNSTAAYGVGPGWDALGDAKTLQKLERDLLLANAKIIDPPMMIDSSVTGDFNRLPGGVTRFNAASGPNAGVKPAYQIDIRVNELQDKINQTQQRIDSMFYVNLFLLLSQRQTTQKTISEVEELKDEKRILSPVLERMDAEILTPLLDRTINIMHRMGKMPIPPREIQGQELVYDYVSVLAMAQKAIRTGVVDSILQFSAQYAQIFPESLDKIDMDAAIDVYSDLIGVPPQIIRDPAKVAMIRNQRQQAQQQQEQLQQAQMAIQGAKSLSQTPVSNDQNALQRAGELSGLPV